MSRPVVVTITDDYGDEKESFSLTIAEGSVLLDLLYSMIKKRVLAELAQEHKPENEPENAPKVNPSLLALIAGVTPAKVEDAITELCRRAEEETKKP